MQKFFWRVWWAPGGKEVGDHLQSLKNSFFKTEHEKKKKKKKMNGAHRGFTTFFFFDSFFFFLVNDRETYETNREKILLFLKILKKKKIFWFFLIYNFRSSLFRQHYHLCRGGVELNTPSQGVASAHFSSKEPVPKP